MPPYWTVAPFALMLLSIAIIPLWKGHWWESNLHKGYVSIVLGGAILAYLLAVAPEGAHHRLLVTLLDYVAFIALLGSLFVISGGIYLRGSLAGTPGVNATILLIGAVLASLMGTTGAAMLLIRPVVRANAWRKSQAHIVVFFTFLVANIGGSLTPLGDPPLYLGFLKGVPFTWTLALWPQWLFTTGLVLAIFFAFDTWKYKSELKAGSKPPEAGKEPLGVDGGLNFLWLLLIIAAIFGSGMLAKSHMVHEWEKSSPLLTEAGLKIGQAIAMLFVAGLSLWTTAKKVREANSFNYAPIIEVAVLFIGIFITMIPALWILDELGRTGKLGLDQPWQFFWASGGLSSFLDNAPTYLTFSSAASGLHDGFVNSAHAVVRTDPNVLTGLLDSTGQLVPMVKGAAGALVPLTDGATTAEIVRQGAQIAPGVLFLKAISCGAVFMGANTYIGNGPNFMVKTIAEQQGVKMPSFFGYMGYSIAILIPTFVIVTLVFFR
ncbi:MAG: sodium:proton antiporter [Acidobacteria bacterium]|nr:sodium:proton antiporter [Acidobacteriota bacterium]